MDPWRPLMAGDTVRAVLFGALYSLPGGAASAWLNLALVFARAW